MGLWRWSGKCLFAYSFVQHLLGRARSFFETRFLIQDFWKKKTHLYHFCSNHLFAKNLALGLNRFVWLILFLCSIEILLRQWLNFGKVHSPYYPFSFFGKGMVLNINNLDILLHNTTLGLVCLKTTQLPWGRYKKCENFVLGQIAILTVRRTADQFVTERAHLYFTFRWTITLLNAPYYIFYPHLIF